jgi:predicted PurR-regulated permease PerM
LVTAALSSLRIGGSVALAVVGYLVLVPVALYYLLVDARRLSLWAASLVPPRLRPSVFGFARECDDLLSHYLRGQVMVMLALAAYYTLALLLLGFDLAVPVGLFTGLAIFVPYLGYGVGLVLALLAGVLQFGPATGVLMVAAVYGLGQVLESFVLTPRWVGERIGLSPLAVIFALLAFGQLLGFVGVLIALPASAVLLVLLRRAQALYFDSKLYRG